MIAAPVRCDVDGIPKRSHYRKSSVDHVDWQRWPALRLEAIHVTDECDTLILPDVVDGGGWQSTIVLTNLSANPTSADLTFHQGTTAGAMQPWTPPFQEVSSTAGLTLNGGSSMFLVNATGRLR